MKKRYFCSLISVIYLSWSGSVFALPQAMQEKIAQSVVNIFCSSTVSGESGRSGSGTIITEDGVILTNSHIIPQDKTNLHIEKSGCLVVLPESTTGKPKDFYMAHPIVIHGLSDKYDLAYMKIYSAFYDEEKKSYQGKYPRKFPNFTESGKCGKKSLKLGEPVRIFGYPAISGGYSLTITDGIISSFPREGVIVTSAKVSHGNSGGLAVDMNGCWIGVPAMVNSDEAESLGVIISMSVVNKFSIEVETYLGNLNTSHTQEDSVTQDEWDSGTPIPLDSPPNPKFDNPDARGWFNKGDVLLYKEKQYKQAVVAYSKAIELDPNNKIPYVSRAFAYAILGDKKQAIEDMKTAANLGSQTAKGWLKSKGIQW